ncbi:hypothetical protein BU14_0031s0035 [Porphyra umbilicalis]|uniref:DUF659 domain-containing protein n=1 Tax=Porphyra umbilicalis TaxID=2786 RepID=A0A1X6PJJ5_PORUM|nr:hypothetical protein BU14_0031s0035 [Porphyra umbilicalis]|eukprot:OSX80863.1 hypothetical protein BU14_0031s0035 [Porphyra umbilicalis]
MVPPPIRKEKAAAPLWRFIKVTVVDGKRLLSCPAPLCTTYRNMSHNATRAKEHLLECEEAHALDPTMRASVVGAAVSSVRVGAAGRAGSSGAQILPPLDPAVLDDWEQRCASLVFGSGLPFSVFHSPEWKSFFSLISGGRFSGPGDPRKVGGSRLDTASGQVAARVDAALRAADTVALTLDGAGDVNGKTTYNVMGCLPRPLLVGSSRLGAMVASAPNLLLAFRACLPSSLHHPMTDVLHEWPATEKSQRLQALGSRRLWALCTDNASVMVSMRNAAEADGLVLASYGCFAHAFNLVSKDLCARAPFSGMLKSVIASTVFFRRCVRGRAELAEDRAIQKAAGNKTSELRTFSPTRWVGQSLTLRSFIDNLPGLRRVLLFNSHKPAGIAFAVPPVVAAAGNDRAVEATARDLLPCLHLLFRMSASLEADASPLSSVLGLFSALHIILRGNIFGVLGATRSFVSDCLIVRFSSYSDPLMVLAFF